MSESDIAEFVNNINTDTETYRLSMWEISMPMTYEDFKISDQDFLILREQCDQFYEGLERNVPSDPFLIPGSGGQTSSRAWRRHRQLLITSSNAKRILGLSSPIAKRNYLQEHLWGMNEFEGNVATAYGNKNEPIARKSYEQVLRKSNPSIQVKETGLWVRKESPQLGCSPDGLVVTRDNNLLKVVEIKCPSVLKDKHPKDFEMLPKQQERTFSLRRDEEGRITIKRDHAHYFQVQFQMYVMRVKTCDYVLWSKLGFLIIPVPYDENFWYPVKDRLHEIHRNLIVVEYFLKRTVRRLCPQDLNV